jgi:glycosyltransferase involved in cell wall biosynthesis
MGPAVSIVIASYNRAKYLGATIDSVLCQTFQDFEVIVVDDGSTDDTRQLVETYGSRVRYYFQANRGPSAARNLGVQNARGRWIAIQDSDDLSLPNHLATLYGYVTAKPECALIFANGSYLGGQEHHRATIIPTEKSRRLAQQGVTLDDIFEKSIVRLQASLIAKSAYDALGGHDESLRICMDLDLAFRLFMNYPVKYLDEIVFQYRKHDGNIGRNEELRLTENIRVIEKLMRDYPVAADRLGRDRVARRLAYRYYRLAKGRWRKNQSAVAREALQQAIRLRPFALKYRLYQLQWGWR